MFVNHHASARSLARGTLDIINICVKGKLFKCSNFADRLKDGDDVEKS